MKRAPIVEFRYVEYCKCRVAAMVASGNLLRSEEHLFYSDKERSLDDLQTALTEGSLQLVDDDLALKLGLASAHWEAAYASTLGVCPPSSHGMTYRLREIDIKP